MSGPRNLRWQLIRFAEIVAGIVALKAVLWVAFGVSPGVVYPFISG